jgi:AcrR family transcriptional regulator
MSKLKIEAWIKAGYKLFGKEGIEGIKVERLARALDLNKSGFYHYFGSMEIYLKSLHQHHVNMAKVIAKEIAGCENLDPDMLLLIIKHKSFFLVESQLLVKSKTPYFSPEFDEAGKIVNKELLPLWRKATQLPEDSTVALSYLNIILHFFYARINSDNLNYEYLHTLTFETEEVLNKVMEEKHVPSPKIEKPKSFE